MLVLSRKKGESVWIEVPQPDGNIKKIKMQIVNTSGKVVKLGIDAPKDWKIYRDELVHQPEMV